MKPEQVRTVLLVAGLAVVAIGAWTLLGRMARSPTPAPVSQEDGDAAEDEETYDFVLFVEAEGESWVARVRDREFRDQAQLRTWLAAERARADGATAALVVSSRGVPATAIGPVVAAATEAGIDRVRWTSEARVGDR